jgi:hypothetical protein
MENSTVNVGDEGHQALHLTDKGLGSQTEVKSTPLGGSRAFDPHFQPESAMFPGVKCSPSAPFKPD